MTIARQRATNARSAPIWRSPATPRAAMLTTNPFDDDKLREECGVFGVSGAADSAAALVALGLHALQHRGQEAAGITSFDGAHFHTHRAMEIGRASCRKESVSTCRSRWAPSH